MWSDDEYFYEYDGDPYDYDYEFESEDSSEYGCGIIMADDNYYSDADSDRLEELLRARGKKRFYGEGNESDKDKEDQVKPEIPSLVDICSRFIALNFPFAYIEGRYPPVPDELQIKIISFSFPEDEDLIKKYAKFSRKSVDFEYPRQLCSKGAVKNLRQIGFRLSATVEDKRHHQSGKCYVAIQFDRGKITSAHCSCNSSINWCTHVIAVIFQRINNKDEASIQLRVPISDSLNSLSHEQLLKLTQYLLCHHQKEPIVDTAQNLVDRLLHPGTRVESSDAQLEDINEVCGAPDPTAGPGFDDESHWFVCQEGFKSQCNSINYESVTDLGFTKLQEPENRRNCDSIHELWISSRGSKPALFKSTVQNDLESVSYYGYTTYRREEELLEALKMIEDLLHGDPVTAVTMLSSCTEQVVNKFKNIDIHRRKEELRYGRSDKTSTLAGTTPKTAQALGFTPRPFSCWTFINEIAQLWRLSILNPTLSPKHRLEVLENLSNWSRQVIEGCIAADLVPWQGLEVASRLGQLARNQSDIEALIQGKLLCQPRVCSYTAVRFSYKKSEVVRQGKSSSSDVPTSQSKGKLPKDIGGYCGYVASFNLPSHICFGSQAVDILTCCSIVDALYLHKDKISAVRLSLRIALSLVTHFKEEIMNGQGSLDLPVDSEIDLDKTGHVWKHETSESDTPMETVSSVSSEGHCCTSAEGRREIWPQGTVLSSTSFVFLYHVMFKNPSIVKPCFTEAKSSGPTVELQLNDIDSADSLMFQFGVFGLLIPRFPSFSSSMEVEQFDYEAWLTEQLVDAKPTEHDLELLSQVASFVCEHKRWSCWFPHALVRVLFCHLFKDASCSMGCELEPRIKLGLKVAFYALESSKTFQATTTGWAMFFYATYRHWASLVELVLESLVGFPKYLEQATENLLRVDISLGRKGDKSSDVNCDDSSRVGQETEISLDESLMEIKARVAFSLAKVLSKKSLSKGDVVSWWATETLKEKHPSKSMEADDPLSVCAIKLGARSLLYCKLSEKIHFRERAVRWLIEFAVKCGHKGIECLMSCEGGVTEFLKQAEVLDLCERIMNKDDRFFVYVRNMLLAQLDHAIRQPLLYKINEVFTFCRGKPGVVKNNVLPWLCQEVQKQTHQREVPFDVLIKASQSLFEFFKDKMRHGDTYLHREEEENSSNGILQYSLARLFREDSAEEEEFVSDPVPVNPYRTPEPHPHLEMAYELGLLAVECADRQSRGEGTENVGYNSRYGVKQRLCDFSRIVCYLTKKSWIKSETDFSSESGEDKDSLTDDTPQINLYLERFVLCLINTVDSPCSLFAVLKEMADHLGPKAADQYRVRYTAEHDKNTIVSACTKYNTLQLLLEKCLDAFTKLITGPKVEKVLEDVCSRHHRQHNQLKWELNSRRLDADTKFGDVLRCAKKAFSVLDESNETFENLLQEMEARYSELKSFLDEIRRDDDERNTDSNITPISLWPFIARGLLPELGIRHLEDQLFW